MHGNWIILGALCGPDDGIYPALVLVPAGDIEIEDVWHTDGMRATGSNDVVITDVYVPTHRLVRVSDIYTGTAPRRRDSRRRHLPLADGARPRLAGGHACARQRRERR
jgi:3-hydroxy-9,10-secoandrosta-1,3,5(10)-triene-9,17-dione monooxygenase